MLSCQEMIDQIQAETGRTGDTELIDETFCTLRLNEANRKIARACPRHKNLTFKNTTSLDATQTLSWSLAEVTSGLSDVTTSNRICHVFDVWYLYGLESAHLIWTETDSFDTLYPDPTHPDVPIDKPVRWTRRGNNIEIMPLCASGYCDNDGGGDATLPGWRFDIGVYPVEFTTDSTEYSDISGSDDGLMLYAKWKAWERIGGQEARTEAAKTKRQWSNPDPLPGEDFGWLENFVQDSDQLEQWDGDLYSDMIE